MTEFDEEELRSLIPKKNFNRVLELLLEKLIYWQMIDEDAVGPRLHTIQKALEIGAIGMVLKILADEIEDCFAMSRYARMLMIWDWIDKVLIIFGINIFVHLPRKLPLRHVILKRLEEQEAWNRAVRALELAFMVTGDGREEMIATALAHPEQLKKKRIEEATRDLPNLQVRIGKARVQARIALLRNDIPACIDHQSVVAELVASDARFPVAEKLHESNVLVHLFAMGGIPFLCMPILEHMAKLPTSNPMEEALRFRFLAQAQMGLAERMWDAKGAVEAAKRFEEWPEAFIPATFPLLWYKVALIHFVNADYRGTIKYLRELNPLPGEDKQELMVWTELLELASHYSLGDLETVDRLKRRVAKEVKASDSSFADLIFRTLKAISHNKAYGREEEVALPFRGDFEQLIGEWEYPDELWYFDFLQWLEARKRGMTCRELHLSGDEAWRWSGHLDEVDPAWSMFNVFYPASVKRKVVPVSKREGTDEDRKAEA